MSSGLLAAAGLGAATGLRSMTGLAMTSLELADRPAEGDGLRHWLGDTTVSYALSALAIGELVADKLPEVPDRVEPPALAGRGLIGALVGAVAGGERHRAAGAVLGAAAAVLSASVGYSVRKEAGWATGLPDPILGVLEDTVAVVLARESARGL